MLNLNFLGALADLTGIVRLDLQTNSIVMTKLANLFPGPPAELVTSGPGGSGSVHLPVFSAMKCAVLREKFPGFPNLCSATALDTVRTVPSSHVVLIDRGSIGILDGIVYAIASREDALQLAGSSLPPEQVQFAAFDMSLLPPLKEAQAPPFPAPTAPSSAKMIIGGLGGAAAGAAVGGLGGAVVGGIAGAVIGAAIT